MLENFADTAKEIFPTILRNIGGTTELPTRTLQARWNVELGKEFMETVFEKEIENALLNECLADVIVGLLKEAREVAGNPVVVPVSISEMVRHVNMFPLVLAGIASGMNNPIYILTAAQLGCLALEEGFERMAQSNKSGHEIKNSYSVVGRLYGVPIIVDPYAELGSVGLVLDEKWFYFVYDKLVFFKDVADKDMFGDAVKSVSTDVKTIIDSSKVRAINIVETDS